MSKTKEHADDVGTMSRYIDSVAENRHDRRIWAWHDLIMRIWAKIKAKCAYLVKMYMPCAYSVGDLLAAHGILMVGLIDESGRFRSGGVGIQRSEDIVHIASPAKRELFAMTDQESNHVTEHLTEQVGRLLNVLGKAPMSSKEIMKKLGLSHRPTFLYSYLHPALAAGVVEMTRPDAPRARNQKYRKAGPARHLHPDFLPREEERRS